MYQRQQNTRNPIGGKFGENIFKLRISSQPLLEGRSLICGRQIKNAMHLDNARNSLLKIWHL